MWILLVGCGDEVGGKLLSSTETPLASVAVRTGEVATVTGSDGGFRAVPGEAVSFSYNGVEYLARTIREAPFHLPAIRKVQVACPLDAACPLVMDFGTHDELTAVVHHACEPGAVFPIDSPNHDPVASCEGGRPLYADNQLDRITLYPQGRAVEVELTAVGPLPSDCEVWVDRVGFKQVAPGRYAGQALGTGWAGGRCAGRPLSPVEVAPGSGRVSLEVPSAGPELVLGELAPWVTELVFSDPRGWSVNVRPTNGVFLLPALPPGDHRLELHGPHPQLGSTLSWPVPTEDGLTVMPAGIEVWLGVWRVGAGVTGPVAVHRPPSLQSSASE